VAQDKICKKPVIGSEVKAFVFGCLLFSTGAAAQSISGFDYISLFFKGIYFSITETVPKEMIVTETGVGETQDQAIQQALNTAVQKTVGVLIISEQTVKDERVVRNLVAQYSSGVVNSFEVKKCSNKPVSCEVTAKVSPWKFMRKLEGDSQTIQVRGDDLLMKHQISKNVMIQRHKITDYYMSQIRRSGLDVNILSVAVDPSIGESVRLSIEYEVRWNNEYKKELIRFLDRLQKDTVKVGSKNQIYIQWGPTGIFENRVRIDAYDQSFWNMMMKHIYDPTYIQIKELGICEDVQSENVFTIDWYGVKRVKTVYVNPNKLAGIKSLTARIGCDQV